MHFLSPAQLVFCLVLFFLPWIEVQCVPNPNAAKGPPPGLGGVGQPPLDPFGGPGMQFGGPMAGPQPLLTQSGLQIATGGFTISNPMLAGEEKGVAKDGPTGAPLLFLFPVVVVIGAIVGFLPIAGIGRKVGVLLCCLVALGTVGAQAALGFPVKKDLDQDTKRSQKAGGGGVIEPGLDVKVVWKIPLYLTFVLLLGAAGTAFLGAAKPANKSRQRYRDDDYDDDRDENEDGRPGRHARREPEDDGDEQDRPRRRARRDDD